jgi:uncharacterized membrane protein YhaH (DUF805 family)
VMEILRARINRATYWTLLALILSIYCAINALAPETVPVSALLLLFICIPRLHDTGRPGWQIWVMVLPAIIALVLGPEFVSREDRGIVRGLVALYLIGVSIIVGTIPGDPGANRYDAPPKRGVFKPGPKPTSQSSAWIGRRLLFDAAKYYFVTDRFSTAVFYPWGKTRQGYEVRSEETRDRIAGAMQRFSEWAFLLLIFIMPAARKIALSGQPWSSLAIVLALHGACYTVMVFRLIDGLPRSTHRLTWIESFERKAFLFEPFHLKAFFVIALLMAISALARIVSGHEVMGERWILLLSGSMVFLCAAWIRVRRRSAATSTESRC